MKPQQSPVSGYCMTEGWAALVANFVRVARGSIDVYWTHLLDVDAELHGVTTGSKNWIELERIRRSLLSAPIEKEEHVRLEQLNNYLYAEKGLVCKSSSPNTLQFARPSLHTFFDRRALNPFIFAPFYIYFARLLNVNLDFVSNTHLEIVRLATSQRCRYFDLSNGAAEMSENALLSALSTDPANETTGTVEHFPDLYLHANLNYFTELELHEKRMRCLELLLQLDSRQVHLWATKAQVHYQQQKFSEAATCLKRYLSFVPYSQASPSAQKLCQLLNVPENIGDCPGYLH